jgi:hypothetical protein
VAELGEEGGLDRCVGGPEFEAFQGFDRLGGNAVALRWWGGAPDPPVEAKELVEEGGTFKGERDGREIGQRMHLEWEHLMVTKWG